MKYKSAYFGISDTCSRYKIQKVQGVFREKQCISPLLPGTWFYPGGPCWPQFLVSSREIGFISCLRVCRLPSVHAERWHTVHKVGTPEVLIFRGLVKYRHTLGILWVRGQTTVIK